MEHPPPPTASGSGHPDIYISDSTWPKRTPKACSGCRRDKVRCDGLRPCGGCVKKSLQCLDGCDPCRRARARCEKTGDSCIRCDRKELNCTEEPSSTHAAPPPVDPDPVAPERARAACQNCRNDSKKCDNQRPCTRCVARSETCVPFPRGAKPTKTRCEGCRKRNIRCEDARPCQSCVTSGTDCVSLIRQGRGCGPRVKAACINCRRSKVRCDGTRPCPGCTRRGLQCQEQLCKRCAQVGLAECTHRAMLNQQNSEDEIWGGPNEPTPSTSNTDSTPSHPQPSPSTSAFPHQNFTVSWPHSGSAPMAAPPEPPRYAFMPTPAPHPALNVPPPPNQD
ncbi:hypothetical protein C8R47DRAFT_1089681 [Mycena vitilis]|nr:hypothetical protein C8R47DRAFT_1089681 [Mycena vitilis]